MDAKMVSIRVGAEERERSGELNVQCLGWREKDKRKGKNRWDPRVANFIRVQEEVNNIF